MFPFNLVYFDACEDLQEPFFICKRGFGLFLFWDCKFLDHFLNFSSFMGYSLSSYEWQVKKIINVIQGINNLFLFI